MLKVPVPLGTYVVIGVSASRDETWFDDHEGTLCGPSGFARLPGGESSEDSDNGTNTMSLGNSGYS